MELPGVFVLLGGSQLGLDSRLPPRRCAIQTGQKGPWLEKFETPVSK